MKRKLIISLVFVLTILILGILLYNNFFKDTLLPNEGVAGIDSNNDGIRDDVEKYIDEIYKNDPKIRLAARQFAKALQIVISNPENALKTQASVRKAFGCMSYLVNDDYDRYQDITDRIKAQVLNTQERNVAYIKYNGKLSGEVLTVPETNNTQCDFDPDRLK